MVFSCLAQLLVLQCSVSYALSLLLVLLISNCGVGCADQCSCIAVPLVEGGSLSQVEGRTFSQLL
jgi:hypothetical protein